MNPLGEIGVLLHPFTWKALILCGAIFLAACSSQPQTDSKSNWYSLCASDAECSDALSCTCGVCTRKLCRYGQLRPRSRF